MKADVEIKGLDELRNMLIAEATLKAKKNTVATYTRILHEESQKRAVFRGHYRGKKFVPPTGFLKRSIYAYSEDNDLTGVVTHGAHYGGYVEMGTRYMAAQPYLRPALKAVSPRFLSAVAKIDKAGGGR